ncbi:hypothetical protein WSM22_30780 [Cytophagales bacterium WSM2-2]|nr:hypothetical protein WSM22_30780 [Cytophagales bacterium WSM2-2]
MNNQNFSTTIVVEQSPSEVYKAINNPRAWWSTEIDGITDEPNAEWNYQYGDNHRSKMKVVEMIPGKKVVWLVEENYFKNAKDQTEWVGNKITFEISKQGDKTQLTFTQIGLTPSYTCYKSCEWAWTGFVQKSLQSLIATGTGQLQWFK